MAQLLVRLGMAVIGLLVVVPASQAMSIQKIDGPPGVEAWLVEDYTVPMIAMDFVFAGGAAQDPADKPGVANMLSSLLDEGAGAMTSAEFQKALDDRSINMSFDAGRDGFYGDLKTLSENRDEAFGLLAAALQTPRLDKEPVERIRAQIAASIKSDANDPQTAATLAVCAKAFPNHPYGRPLDGTAESVAAISRDDLETYRSHVFARDNLKVAIVGAISAKEAGTMLARVFGPLPDRAKLTPVADIVPQAGIIAIDQPNPQTLIRFGGPGIKRDDPDFMAGYVVNHILGGGSFSSRLYTEVREKRGLAYTVSTSLVTLAHADAFAGGTATRADRAPETIALIKSEVARFAAEGPTEAELAKAKSYMIGSYALRFDSSSKIARQVLGIMVDNLGIDYVEKRNSLIEAITIEDARRAARRLFVDGTTMVATVGPAKTKTATAETQVPPQL
ncbi:zinc protease [Kaistia soli DSM 19436]|uniref:Zinc protease n=1 Tax=Kaistia soli DSM 19436 TaxID=1122133 RepID=A0A1M4W4C8_9HYPH|nr:pitrilysin family protein [Kaistia soli]SHE75802.1 zinc protease [Kaistia soli DSM 19436]